MNRFYSAIQYANVTNKHVLDFVWKPYFENLNGKVLDIGCFHGTLASGCSERIVGVDNDKDALQVCRERGFEVKQADLEGRIPFKSNSFAGVFCSHTIEHLYNPLNLLKEILRVLKPGGKLILLTPDYILTHDKEQGFWADYDHKKPFIKTSLERIAFDAGFRNFSVKHRISQFKGMTFFVKHFGLELVQKFFSGNDLLLEAFKPRRIKI